MASINLIKASDGTGNASTATVQTVRNSGVTTIIVDTVNNIPATFMGSMGTPHTFVDPVTAEEIKVISEATAVDFTGHVSGVNLEIDSIAPGYTDLGSAVGDIVVIRPTTEWANNVADVLLVSHDNDGTLKAGAVDVAAVLASDVVTTAKIADNAVTTIKLAEAFFKGRRQANTTNSDISGYKVQHGWGFMLGSGAASSTEAVVLPTAFGSAAYIVVATCIGYKVSDPSNESDFTIASSINATAKIVDGAQFTIGLHDSASTMGATTRFGYTWIAIGPA